MGHKLVCLNCHRVENLGTDLTNIKIGDCPECSSPMHFINHKFRPPKKHDKKAWKVVKFLISEGFTFQHIYTDGNSEYSKSPNNNYTEYPKTMHEAIEFVKKHRDKSE